ncbi:phage late control D family protein [Nocardioides bigeumensis]|uniref:Phage late control D family protein n=1 Tax=Nocardioides bigeumensis TaxID=433657 RepID=A0ABN2YAM5_9ACTN
MTATPVLTAATPTIEVKGEPSGLLGASLEDLVVTETLEGLATCEARFRNVGAGNGDPDYLFFDGDVLDFGVDVRISTGAGEGTALVFSGNVTGLRAEFSGRNGATLTMLAEDRLQDLRMTRRTRSFEDMTDAAAFEQIASDHRLRAEIDLPGPTYRVIAQVDQSDLAFLRTRARRAGAEVWVRDDTLHVAARTTRRGERVVLGNQQNLLEASLFADLAAQRTEVQVHGWDPSTKERLDERATGDVVKAEASGDKVGPDVLERAFGRRVETIAHQVPLGPDEARALAKSQMLERARRFVTGEILAVGDARIAVGGTVDLSGVGAPFSGVYYVVEARHLFDLVGGYRTLAKVERGELTAT